jgi:hypothetical protein
VLNFFAPAHVVSNNLGGRFFVNGDVLLLNGVDEFVLVGNSIRVDAGTGCMLWRQDTGECPRAEGELNGCGWPGCTSASDNSVSVFSVAHDAPARAAVDVVGDRLPTALALARNGACRTGAAPPGRDATP